MPTSSAPATREAGTVFGALASAIGDSFRITSANGTFPMLDAALLSRLGLQKRLLAHWTRPNCCENTELNDDYSWFLLDSSGAQLCAPRHAVRTHEPFYEDCGLSKMQDRQETNARRQARPT